MEETREQEQMHAAPLSIEDAVERKQDILVDEQTQDKDLEAMLHQLQTGSKQAYLEQLTGIKRVVAEVKEMLGYGVEHDYAKHRERMNAMSAQLRAACESTGALIGEYRKREQDTRESYTRSKRLLVLNDVIYTAKEKQKAEKQARLVDLEAPSVLGSTSTAETLQLEDEVSELDEDLWKLDMESDDAAMKFKVAETTHVTHRQLRQNLQGVYKELQKQRSMFEAHNEVTAAHDRIVGKLKGVSSIKVLYAEAGTLIQKLDQLQQYVQRTLDPLPLDFRIRAPATQYRERQDKPYWRTVLQEIQRR